jgi:hypothetical protein
MGADCSPPSRQARGPRTTGGRSHDSSRGNPVRRNSNRLIEFVPPGVDDGLPVDGVDGGQDAIFELCTKNSRCT